jgi:phthiodiolone/phenolphthiodiolone dimycocerosates ketoreductase
MLRLTGQYGDGWLPCQVETPDEYHTLKSVIAEHAAAAGRPEPESGPSVFTVLGENREQVKQLYDSQPMAKLFALWSATPSQWQKYGFSGRPSGTDCRGYLDYVPHLLDAAMLRQLAVRIPFELLEEHIFVGNARGGSHPFAGICGRWLRAHHGLQP